MNNRRAQVGETMTWVVATIVIIVILGISIFIVKFSLNQKEFNPFISNDLIATKSAVSFLSFEDNLDNLKKSIGEGDYTPVKPKIEKFLERISTDRKWNFRVFIDDEISNPSAIVTSTINHGSHYAYLTFDSDNKKIELKFDDGEK